MGPLGFHDRRRKEERVSMDATEWIPTLVSLTVKSIVVIVAATIITRVVRTASARFRHLLWCAALSSLLLFPLVSSQLQPIRLAVLQADVVNESSVPNFPILPAQVSTILESNAVDSPAIDTQSSFELSWRTIL